MESLEEFKQSRLKIDPSARKLTEMQWEQAFEAYKTSRQRVGQTGQSSEEGGSSRRSSSRKRSSSSRRHASGSSRASVQASASLTKTGLLKFQIQKASAYQDLRLLVNVLAYVLIALIVISVLFNIFVLPEILMAISILLTGLCQIVGVLILRMLIQALVDIPDILLYRATQDASDPNGDLDES